MHCANARETAETSDLIQLDLSAGGRAMPARATSVNASDAAAVVKPSVVDALDLMNQAAVPPTQQASNENDELSAHVSVRAPPAPLPGNLWVRAEARIAQLIVAVDRHVALRAQQDNLNHQLRIAATLNTSLQGRVDTRPAPPRR